MNTVRAFLVGVLSDIYRSRPVKFVWQWAEEVVFLSKEESQDFSGRYRSTRTPYTRFMMEAATDSNVREFIVMKSSQLGFTLAALIIILYWIAHRMGNIIYALDSTGEMRRVSKSRLQPLIERCPATRDELSGDPDDVTNLTYFLKRAIVYLVGAFSAGVLANKSASLVVVDELDKHPPQPQNEASTLDLLRQRLKRVLSGKLFAFSSPSLETGPINQEYLTGTRHKVFLACPRCEHWQELVWEHVRFQHCKDLAGNWDYGRMLKETYYECELCHKPIEESEKAGMLEKYECRRTNFGQDDHKPVPGKVSMHISDLYSTFPTSTWGQIAVEYCDSEGNTVKRKNWWNNRMGLPWHEKRSEVKESHIHAMCGVYEHGHCPFPPVVVLMAADTQDDRSKWVKAAFNDRGDCWVVDYGTTIGMDELIDIADAPVIVDNWMETPEADRVNPVVFGGLVDEGGHRKKDVRDFCQRTDERFFPCKGRGGVQVRDVVEERDHFIHNGQPMVIYHFSDDDFKSELYLDRIGKFKEIEKAAREGGRHAIPRLWFPYRPDPEFVSELCQERRVQAMVRGRLAWIWEDPKNPNDFGDALKMCFVAWYRLKEHFMAPPPTEDSDKESA